MTWSRFPKTPTNFSVYHVNVPDETAESGYTEAFRFTVGFFTADLSPEDAASLAEYLTK